MDASTSKVIYENSKLKNIFGEPISLKISDFDSFLEITVRRLNGVSFISVFLKSLVVIWSLLWLTYFIFVKLHSLTVLSHLLPSLAISCVYVVIRLYLTIEKESLLFVDSIDGVQYSTVSALGTERVTFIPTQNVIINEGITFWRVIFYMALTKKTDENLEITPIFCHIYPELQCLKYIYTYTYLNKR